MTKFSISTDKIRNDAGQLDSIQASVNKLQKDMRSARKTISRMKTLARTMPALEMCIENTKRCTGSVGSLRDTLINIAARYDQADSAIIANGSKEDHFNHMSSGAGDGNGESLGKRRRTYDEWGIGGGSVRTVEYAYLSSFCNEVSKCKTTQEMEEMYKNLIKANFPDDHPLQNMKITAYKGGTNNEMDAIVIEIDADHAIVVFGGTVGGDDIVTDIGLVSDTAPGLQEISAINHVINPIEHLTESQFEAANKLINDLPYKDIKVTGHSLGGHLAADVTLNNDKISMCTTFDPPGRGDVGFRNTFDEARVVKITNYCAEGSTVSKVGDQVGKTFTVKVEENHNAGFTNHSIDYMIDSFGGKDELTAPDAVD